MRRLASCLLFLSLVACGSDPDPHAPATCSGWTDNLGNPFTGQCEAACAMPPASTGNACDTTQQLNCAEFDYEGIDGCCIQDGTTIKFFECVP